MVLFWYYIIGYVLTVITFGVLYKTGKWTWHPKGNTSCDDAPPHMVAAIFWPIILVGIIIWKAVVYIYRGFNLLTDLLVNIKIERTDGGR